jgi:hypothetical protein
LIVTKRIAVLALTVALSVPAAASAQSFGQFTGAQTLAPGAHLGGGYLQSSSSVLGLLAQLRMSFYPGVDFGFQGGFARQNYPGSDRTTLRLATDLKYQVVQPTAEYPYSLSVGGGLGVESGDNWNVLSLGPSLVSSRSFPGNGDLVFTPFVGVGLLFSNVNVGPLNESDMSIPLRLGSEVRLTPQLTLTGELQLRLGDTFNDDVGFSLGFNSPF